MIKRYQALKLHKAVEKLNNEINTEKSKIDKLIEEVSEINQKIRKEESISRESESALKLKIGTIKKLYLLKRILKNLS